MFMVSSLRRGTGSGWSSHWPVSAVTVTGLIRPLTPSARPANGVQRCLQPSRSLSFSNSLAPRRHFASIPFSFPPVRARHHSLTVTVSPLPRPFGVGSRSRSISFLVDSSFDPTVRSLPSSVSEIKIEGGVSERIVLDLLAAAPNLRSLMLPQGNRYRIPTRSLPSSLIQLDNYFPDLAEKEEFSPSSLPANLGDLTFSSEFQSPINLQQSFPHSLRHLSFGHKFQHAFNLSSLPRQMIRLKFDESFNSPLHGQYPKFRDGIIFLPTEFNQPLPQGIFDQSDVRYIEFGPKFCQPIDLSLFPASLKRLDFKNIVKFPLPLQLNSNSQRSELKFLILGAVAHPIQPNMIPNSVTKLHFERGFNQPILSNSLPANLKILSIGESWNHPFPDKFQFPPSLEFFYYGNCQFPFNLNSLHSSLQKIEFENFNSVLHGRYPSNCKSILIPNRFSQPLRHLFSEGNETIDFGYDSMFQQSFHSTDFPTSIKRLLFSNSPQSPLLLAGCSLPSSLEVLALNAVDRRLPADFLPSALRLRSLYLGKYFNLSFLSNSLPSQLETLSIARFHRSLPRKFQFPPSLRTLKLHYDTTNCISSRGSIFRQALQWIGQPSQLISAIGDSLFGPPRLPELPSGLESLTVERCPHPIEPGHLPSSLLELNLSKVGFPLAADVLPPNLERFLVDSDVAQLFPDNFNFPTSLRTLQLSGRFNQPVNFDHLPDSLTQLKFGAQFDSAISGRTPSGIKSFRLPGNSPIAQIRFSEGLEELEFSCKFQQPFDPAILPKSLRKLSFDHQRSNPLLLRFVPQPIESLTLGALQDPIGPQFFPADSNLTELILSISFQQPIPLAYLPPRLKRLTFHTSFSSFAALLESCVSSSQFNSPDQFRFPSSLEMLQVTLPDDPSRSVTDEIAPYLPSRLQSAPVSIVEHHRHIIITWKFSS